MLPFSYYKDYMPFDEHIKAWLQENSNLCPEDFIVLVKENNAYKLEKINNSYFSDFTPPAEFINADTLSFLGRAVHSPQIAKKICMMLVRIMTDRTEADSFLFETKGAHFFKDGTAHSMQLFYEMWPTLHNYQKVIALLGLPKDLVTQLCSCSPAQDILNFYVNKVTLLKPDKMIKLLTQFYSIDLLKDYGQSPSTHASFVKPELIAHLDSLIKEESIKSLSDTLSCNTPQPQIISKTIKI